MSALPSSLLVVGATPSVERTDTVQAISQRGCGGPEAFSFGSVPRPRIEAHEVLVRVGRAGQRGLSVRALDARLSGGLGFAPFASRRHPGGALRRSATP